MSEINVGRAFHAIKSKKSKGASLATIGAAAISATFSSREPVNRLEAVGRIVVADLLGQGRINEERGRYRAMAINANVQNEKARR